ncbi:hypothetical protein [Prescottella agglutinans]|uniref:Uncharacterized protein n=1 Tax=Prescottella agglutinans TaxID=1644129 RepID=A0ABT6MK09_9NOCA|nr:hypothetical protein [Prescottella agglutinans]MDH6284632.1 hypothetical protein [Prescottella agglutinans]
MNSTPDTEAETASARGLTHRPDDLPLDALADVDGSMVRPRRDLPEDSLAADVAAALGTSSATA